MELFYMSLMELAERIRSRALSPVEVTAAMLDRIGRVDAAVSSYAHVSAEPAMAAARRAEVEIMSGSYRGPLHGVPMAVKDLAWTTDAPTTAGTAVHDGFMAAEDATCVARLREAGAVILGKLKLTEGAYTDHHSTVQPPKNPWSADHWAGASSSGSGAATAAGLCFASLGTDTGGSIRFPSGANGITGLKPTWGRVSRHGVFALAETYDHVGPMTREVRDAAAVLAAIAGADDRDPTAALEPVPDYLAIADEGVAGLTLGIDSGWLADVDRETGAVLDEVVAVARAMGLVPKAVTFPESAQVVADWFPHCGAEAAVAHEATYPAQKDLYGPSLAGLIELGRSLSAVELEKILLRRHAFTGRVRRFFADVDLLLLPVQGIAAPTLAWMSGLGGNQELVHKIHRYTSPFTSSGMPTVTMRGGATAAGLPIGFQFASGAFREDALLRAGVAYQKLTDWHRRHPPV